MSGRAGRQALEGTTAHITVWWRKSDVKKGKAAESMRSWLSLSASQVHCEGAGEVARDAQTCRRALAQQYFAFRADVPAALPTSCVCCDLCRPSCDCGQCPEFVQPPGTAVPVIAAHAGLFAALQACNSPLPDDQLLRLAASAPLLLRRLREDEQDIVQDDDEDMVDFTAAMGNMHLQEDPDLLALAL